MAVAGVAAHVAELDQRIERAVQRLSADIELPLQLDEPCASAIGEQCERRRSPAVMEKRDK